MGLVMCDIDGCVADVKEEFIKYMPDWDEYFSHMHECKPIKEVIELLRALRGVSTLIFYTGRPESTREVTESWLRVHVTSGGYRRLLMRLGGSTESTQELKLLWFNEFKPDLIIDDDPTVVEAARKAGFTVLQVHGYRWDKGGDSTPGEVVPEHFPDGTFSFSKNSVGFQSPEQTLLILLYELGHLAEYRHRENVYGPSAYWSKDNQKKEMSDLISMARYYCEQRGWDYEELKEYGEKGYIDRMNDMKDHGIKLKEEN